MMAQILVGMTDAGEWVGLELSRVNRHGLVAGATGTGKTVTLQSFAEQLAQAGVCVWVSDVKGDLGGILGADAGAEWVRTAFGKAGLDYAPQANAGALWKIGTVGDEAVPARVTVDALGALLTARLLDLNAVQTGVVQVAFAVAEDKGWALVDLADLRTVLGWLQENAALVGKQYGAVSAASVASINRAILGLNEDGGEALFGAPALDVRDLLTTRDGKGMVHVLDSVQLMQQPRVYGVFLLYMLQALFATLPEVGDVPQPKLVLFLDEAHLLFKDAPKPLLEKVEQVVRLIRSKGVGVWLVTQQPSDVPDSVLAQLGNRVQHALRAATPQGQKDIKVAATTMASNPAFDTAAVLPQLAVGEALVSVLDKAGVPTSVQRTRVLPPQSKVGPLTAEERVAVVRGCGLVTRYAAAEKRELRIESREETEEAAPVRGGKAVKEEKGMVEALLLGDGRRQGLLETAAKSVVRNVAGQVGRALLRGVMSSLKR